MTDEDLDAALRTGGGLDAISGLRRAQVVNLEGRVLGEYRITGFIAEGGMGRVYRAARIDGSFERDVAIKISPASGIDERMYARFKSEQALLASLDHPHIAQLFDARTTEEGWPYFVMELVDGGPITDYCASASLSTEDRVRLMVNVVDAVAYAHSRLVVHRDLKPSNILVSSDGRAKLLDFGIAKLLESDSGDQSKVLPLTPRYASPEQLLGQPVTVASGLFQLGILLHELLMGFSPISDETLADAVARASSDSPVSLTAEVKRSLPRDLVQVIEQCLRPNAEERYRDAYALRDDLEAWLDGYPVRAAGQNTGYRMRKFCRRNWLPLSLSAGFLSVIIASTVWYFDSLRAERDAVAAANEQAQREARTASGVTDFLLQMIRDANEIDVADSVPTLNDAILQGSLALQNQLLDQPEVRARLADQLSLTLVMNQQPDAARELLQAVLEDLKEDAAVPFGMRAGLLIRSIYALYQQGQFDDARKDYLDAIAWLELNQESGSLAYAEALTMLGLLERRARNYDLALQYFERAAPIMDSPDTTTEKLAGFLGNYSLVASNAGEDERAVELNQRSSAEFAKAQGEDSPRIAMNLGNLAWVYRRLERYDEAMEAIDRADRIFKARMGEDYGSRQASLIMERAAVYEKLGQFDASMQAHVRATEIYEESLGTSHSLYALSIHNHAQSLKNFGRCDLALPKFRRARELQVVLFGEDSEWTRRNDDRIAECESTTAGSEVQ